MPKVAYTPGERQKIREALIAAALETMALQGVQHTTVEQIYKQVGISRSFFYSFFPTKEDLVVEALYYQQPKVLAYARSLMDDPSRSWQEGVETFLRSCCYGEKNGIAVLTPQDQQSLFHGLTPQGNRIFREKQLKLFGDILAIFQIRPNEERVQLFTNISLMAMVLRSAIVQTLPLFVPQAVDATVDFQIHCTVQALEKMRMEDQQD